LTLTGGDGLTGDRIGGPTRPSGRRTFAGPLSAATRFCAWIESDPSATQAAAGPASATVAVPPPPPLHRFRGRTSQNLPITIVSQGAIVREIVCQVHYSCPRAVYLKGSSPRIRWNGESVVNVLTSDNFGTLRIHRDGTFKARLHGNRL